MELLFIFIILLIFLTIMVVVGHVIWVVIAALIRWVFNLESDKDTPPTIYTPPPPDPKAQRLKDLAATEKQIISFYTDLVRVGRTSITIRVTVEAERWGVPPTRMGITGHGELVKVTEAEVILVAVNDQGRPIPIRPEGGGN